MRSIPPILRAAICSGIDFFVPGALVRHENFFAVEMWLEPRGGLMIGVHRDVQGDRVTSFEFLRIAAATDGSIVYLASPQGRPATEFPLKELTGDRAVSRT